MSDTLAIPNASLSDVDLRETWKKLLTGPAVSRDESELLTLADEVDRRLESLHAELPDPAQALLFLLNRAGIQRVWEESKSWRSVPFVEHLTRVEAFHDDLERCLQIIDPKYNHNDRDRRSVDTRGVMTPGHLEFLGLKPASVTKGLCRALERAGLSANHLQTHAFIDELSGEYTGRIDQVGRRAFGFRVLRWRLQVYLSNCSKHPAASELVRRNHEQNLKWEMKALWLAAQSAGERGWYATEAAIGTKLLHEIAQSYSNSNELDKELAHAVRVSCHSIRQLGFSVPEDFRDNGKFSFQVLPNSCFFSEPAPYRQLPRSRLYRIYRTVPRERFFALAKASGVTFNDKNPFGLLKEVVKHKSNDLIDTDRETLFDVCVRLDGLKRAMKLLKNCPSWTPSSGSLKNLAHHLIVAQRAMPAGIREDKQADWLNPLCKAWGAATTNQYQEALIHQAVLGRMTSLAMGSGSSTIDPSSMLGKANEDRGKFSHQFRLQVSVDGFLNFRWAVRKFESAAQTIVLSAALRGSGLHAYALTSSSKAPQTEMLDNIQLSACREAALFVQRVANRDLLLGQTLLHSQKMRPLVLLAERLLDLVRKIDHGCKLLMLAIEPDLAPVPWNVLLPAVGGENVPLVSLIPSLSWLRDHNRKELVRLRQSSKPRCVTPSVESLASAYPSEDMHQFARLIAAAQALTDSPIAASRSVLVGHGRWDQARQMTTVIGPDGPITWENWLELLPASLVVINSCQGGMTNGHLVADLAGLPGLALAAGCQCLLAPLTRLRPDDLADLCMQLAHADAGATALDRLNTAFAYNPAVRQVAVFGDPTIRLLCMDVNANGNAEDCSHPSESPPSAY